MSREIPLSQGYVAIVDDEDYELVMAAGPWRANPVRGGTPVYATATAPHPDGGFRSAGSGRKRRTQISMHKLITGYEMTDHANGDGLDNRRGNLREATRSQNGANSRLRSSNTSGYRGVSWLARNKKWQVHIKANGKSTHVGTFVDKREAAMAYDRAAREVFGEFARLNFPLPGERAA